MALPTGMWYGCRTQVTRTDAAERSLDRFHRLVFPEGDEARTRTGMSFQDKALVCRDCGQEFAFTAGEQEFYASKGLVNEPQRCQSCRAVAKQNRALGLGSGGGGNGGGQREMHAAVCAECGGQALVPFLPRNDRPVYCSNCFDKVRARA